MINKMSLSLRIPSDIYQEIIVDIPVFQDQREDDRLLDVKARAKVSVVHMNVERIDSWLSSYKHIHQTNYMN